MTSTSNYDDLNTSETVSGAYKASALIIFIIVSYTFLFPCNKLIPLDRRTVGVLCATLCYITRAFAFRNRKMDIVQAIDFDVLVLLASIMAINHLVVHLKETKRVIEYLQGIIQAHPVKGFWMVSIAAFLVSPFLTNDGVCLLFVEPILNAFEATFLKESNQQKMLTTDNDEEQVFDEMADKKSKLQGEDALYFMLTLACSSNIGSALTYTGNPQNMIVAQDAIEVLSPIKFTAYMLIPVTLSWIMTTWWIQYCWFDEKRKNREMKVRNEISMDINDDLSYDESNKIDNISNYSMSYNDSKPKYFCLDIEMISNKITSPLQKTIASLSPVKSPLTPRRRKMKIQDERQEMINRVVKVISSPFPYMILIFLLCMIVMIFVDVMSISGLVCVSAVVMVTTLVIGNHWRGRKIWHDLSNKNEDHDRLLSDEEKLENSTEFFEELFKSLDYSLLIIFLGTFIVVANIASTGIPKAIWNKIVGQIPFHKVGSILGICSFVLIASQFLGNVAIVQLAKPNVEILSHQNRLYAWALISFVSTIGGNLTITGSAANIIVSEKGARIDPESSLDFHRHIRVCFVVTLLSCFIGGLVITGLVSIDNRL